MTLLGKNERPREKIAKTEPAKIKLNMAPKQDAKVCWDYWECKPDVKENCPAFKTQELCWRVATQYCGRVSGKYGFEKCITCEWYRLNHPPRDRKATNYGL